MPWVYSVGTIIIGFFFYWLRNNHRVFYGLSEILAALALIYVAYFPHGVGGIETAGGAAPPYISTIWDTLISRAVPFFTSVYAFVRGCDNIVVGLREPEI